MGLTVDEVVESRVLTRLLLYAEVDTYVWPSVLVVGFQFPGPPAGSAPPNFINLGLRSPASPPSLYRGPLRGPWVGPGGSK